MPTTPMTPVTPLLDLSRVKLAQGGPPPGSSMSTRTGLEELDEKNAPDSAQTQLLHTETAAAAIWR
eukprot:CAMPEP_0113881702 /NCGR_PEP_ID=MMETSP0780_2-20120614/8528_1 /TAXON_ID=652834 /ORGANISM="Palpitomonas bilix" /LENGTH=65 /DNA_ID=CAMNT_0000868599 /DNA_START=69 /DNA_END=262 /DNA_ORIENTATION=+ /assembly_acc=CAM_ASM_000599